MSIAAAKDKRIAAHGPRYLRRLVLRAFRVDVTDWPEATSIVLTTSASKAKFVAWSSANEVGYNLPFGRFRVRRAPEYDRAKLEAGRPYGEDYAISQNDKRRNPEQPQETYENQD